MEVVVESERDRRTLDWLVTQVGEDRVTKMCLQLAGKRRPYVSNVAKALGLVPPESILQTSSVDAREQLSRLKALIKPVQR